MSAPTRSLTDREQLEADARRLDCLPAIQPLLDIIDWCGRAREKLDGLDEIAGTRRRDLE